MGTVHACMHILDSHALLAMEFLPHAHAPLKSLKHALFGPGSNTWWGGVRDSKGAHASLAIPRKHHHRRVQPDSTPTARPPNGTITIMSVNIRRRARHCRQGSFSNCRVSTKLAFSPGDKAAISAISFTTHPDLLVKLDTPASCCKRAHHPVTVRTGNELL